MGFLSLCRWTECDKLQSSTWSRHSARPHLDNWNILFSSSSLHVFCRLNMIFLPTGTICHLYGGTNPSHGAQTGSSLILGSLRMLTLIYIKAWHSDLIINLMWFSRRPPPIWCSRRSLIDYTFPAGLINITQLSVKTLTWTCVTLCCPVWCLQDSTGTWLWSCEWISTLDTSVKIQKYFICIQIELRNTLETLHTNCQSPDSKHAVWYDQFM